MFVLQDRLNKTEYTILDTSDDIVETFTYNDIIHCVMDLGLKIQGVSINGSDIYFEKFNVKYKNQLIGNKFRIYPTNEQKVILAKMFGSCRFIWNKMLSERIDYYNLYKESLDNHYND